MSKLSMRVADWSPRWKSRSQLRPVSQRRSARYALSALKLPSKRRSLPRQRTAWFATIVGYSSLLLSILDLVNAGPDYCKTAANLQWKKGTICRARQCHACGYHREAESQTSVFGTPVHGAEE